MDLSIPNSLTELDIVEYLMANAASGIDSGYEAVDCPLKHTFTPGLYSREIFMKKGLYVLSETHLTEHQYVLADGVVSVWTEEEGWQILKAPHVAITKPGTRRLLKIEMDAIWVTFHATSLTSVEEIEDTILEKKINPLIEGFHRQNKLIKKETLLLK